MGSLSQAQTKIMLEAELERRDLLRSVRSAFLKKCKKQKGGGGSCAAAFDKFHFALLRRADAADDPVSQTCAHDNLIYKKRFPSHRVRPFHRIAHHRHKQERKDTLSEYVCMCLYICLYNMSLYYSIAPHRHKQERKDTLSEYPCKPCQDYFFHTPKR